MKMYRWIAFFGACALAQACKKSEPEQAPTDPTPSAAPEPEPVKAAEVPAPAATGAPSEPTTQVTDGLPTEEDFEEEAGAVITAENLEAELDKLEAEIKPN